MVPASVNTGLAQNESCISWDEKVYFITLQVLLFFDTRAQKSLVQAINQKVHWPDSSETEDHRSNPRRSNFFSLSQVTEPSIYFSFNIVKMCYKDN